MKTFSCVATVTERKRDISRFIQIVGKYSDIQELTYENADKGGEQTEAVSVRKTRYQKDRQNVC